MPDKQQVLSAAKRRIVLGGYAAAAAFLTVGGLGFINDAQGFWPAANAILGVISGLVAAAIGKLTEKSKG